MAKGFLLILVVALSAVAYAKHDWKRTFELLKERENVKPSPSKRQTSDIRLADGNGTAQGRVEVYYDGAWGTVCDDWWEDDDAVVACRQLGFGGGVAMTWAHFGSGEGAIWLDNVECVGDENSLADCEHNGWGDHNCQHSEDAGVVCSELRLVGGSVPSEGRVEIYHDGEWGTVCDDWWQDEDAAVACRYLGYSGGEAVTESHFGNGEGAIWLDNLHCYGDETLLSECVHMGWGIHNCAHTEDAGVICEL